MFLGQAAESEVLQPHARMKHLRLMTGKKYPLGRPVGPAVQVAVLARPAPGGLDQLRSRGGCQPSQALALNVAARGGQLASVGPTSDPLVPRINILAPLSRALAPIFQVLAARGHYRVSPQAEPAVENLTTAIREHFRRGSTPPWRGSRHQRRNTARWHAPGRRGIRPVGLTCRRASRRKTASHPNRSRGRRLQESAGDGKRLGPTTPGALHSPGP